MSPDDLMRELERMSPEQRRRLIAYARGSRTIGEPGRNLRPFAGVLTPQDAREMSEAIDRGCERIEPDAW